MPLNTLYFQQYGDRVPPNPNEVFAQAKKYHALGVIELYVIGSSHHLILEDCYTERLSCETNLPEQLRGDSHCYKKDTPIGVFRTRLWQEAFPNDQFPSLEQEKLSEDWDIKHCFLKNAAFTAIRVNDNTIVTLHSYPEHCSLVFSETTLPID